MSPSESSVRPVESGGRRFEMIANGLYGLPPGEFVAARDEHVRHARASGERGLAARLVKLRRPTQAAWLVNLLWRDQRGRVGEFLQLADAFREAQQRLLGGELRQLSRQRQQLLNGLLEQARRLGAAAGAQVSADMVREVGATLEAALADSKVAAQVRLGRLTQPASYAGFGPVAPAGLVESRPERRDTEGREVKQPGGQDTSEGERGIAQHRVTQAREQAERMGRELTDRKRALGDLARRRDELRDRSEALQHELEQLGRQLSQAEQDLRTASGQYDRAAEVHARTQRDLTAAEADLDNLK